MGFHRSLLLFLVMFLMSCTAQQSQPEPQFSKGKQEMSDTKDIKRAIDLSNNGNWQQALELLNHLTSKTPDDQQVRFERAMVHLNLDNTQLAIDDLEFVFSQNPNFSGVLNWLAIAKSDLGKFSEAGELKFSELQGYEPTNWAANGQAWSNCAKYFLKASNPERALEVLDLYFEKYEAKQIGYERYLPAPYNYKSKALLALGRADEALLAADAAILLPHSTPSDKFMRIMALANIGEIETAIAELSKLEKTYKGTAPYNDTVAEFKRLKIPL